MTSPSKPVVKPGRVPVPCPVCGGTVAFLAAEAVKRVGRLTGHGLIPVTTMLRTALGLGVVRCPTCEAKS